MIDTNECLLLLRNLKYSSFHIVFCNKWTQAHALDDYVAIIVSQESERLFSLTLYMIKCL